MFKPMPYLIALHIFWIIWCFTDSAAKAADIYAVVERDGTVALCLSNGSLLFADRCQGNGRLSIVQPIKEGTVVWRSAIGTVSLENGTANAECTLGHANWDPKSEQVVSTGRKISNVDRTKLLDRLKKNLLKDASAIEDDIKAFSLDLDGDGKEETVFAISNLNRLDDHSSGEPVPYFTYGGVLQNNSPFPTLFYSDRGEYFGGTDAIGPVTIKGVAPIAPGTGEIALLVKAGSGLSGTQTLIRYRFGAVQRIDTIEFTCN